jgi:predicted DNA-binding transcriptional regulator AlpA
LTDAPTTTSIARRVIRPRAISERTGYAIPTIHRKARDPEDDFPALLVLGANAVGAYEDEIDAYMASRPRTKPAPEESEAA